MSYICQISPEEITRESLGKTLLRIPRENRLVMHEEFPSEIPGATPEGIFLKHSWVTCREFT